MVSVLSKWLFSCLVNVVQMQPATAQLHLVAELPQEAQFVGVTTDGDLEFQAEGETRLVSLQKMRRWSAPPVALRRNELVLNEGSRLVLADAWTGEPAWDIDGAFISIKTQLLGAMKLRRDQVRAIVLHAPTSLQQHAQFFDRLLSVEPLKSPTDSELPGSRQIASSPKQPARQGDIGRSAVDRFDALRLTSGDQLTGHLTGLTESGDGKRQIVFSPEALGEAWQVPEERVAAILLGNRHRRVQPAGKLVVGLRDGSLLMAESVVSQAGRHRLQLAGGLELAAEGARDVVYLRSLAPHVDYLSDQVHVEYQHVPYLDIAWPYRRDRNSLGGYLQVAGRIYEKGLGTHTASRMTFRLDSPEIVGRFQQFMAAVAVDDAAQHRGSVLFRVYLRHDAKWRQVYASPVVRGGDAPLAISVELDGAQQIALVTDFADRGDECDYANWLEARLE